MPLLDTPGGRAIMEAFRERGITLPHMTVTTLSVHLRNFLAMSGRFVVAVPVSNLELYGKVFDLKRLPIELPAPQLPYAIISVKNRTLSPAAQLFLACAREVAAEMASPPRSPPSAPAARSAAPG
jgi:DNA-binding transcriptional LysR family regulator